MDDGPGRVLILSDDMVVATDLTETAGIAFPEAAVTLARTVAEAEGLIEGGAFAAAILVLRMQPLIASRLGALLAAGGGRVVVLSSRASEAERALFPGWRFVALPFASESVIAALR